MTLSAGDVEAFTTFFTTMPPVSTSAPSTVANLMPITRSRPVPYSRRRGPLKLAATSPPRSAELEPGIERQHQAVGCELARKVAELDARLDGDRQIARLVPKNSGSSRASKS